MGSEAASGFCTCITTFLCDTCSSPCFSFPFLAEPELCLRFLFLGFPASNVRGILSCLFHVNQRKRKWVILIESTKLGSDVLYVHTLYYFSLVCSQITCCCFCHSRWELLDVDKSTDGGTDKPLLNHEEPIPWRALSC